MLTEDRAQAMLNYSKTEGQALCLEFPEWIGEKQLEWPRRVPEILALICERYGEFNFGFMTTLMIPSGEATGVLSMFKASLVT